MFEEPGTLLTLDLHTIELLRRRASRAARTASTDRDFGDTDTTPG